MKTELYIKRGKHYIQEGLRQGEFGQTLNIDNAMSFIDYADLKAYVENDMNTNIDCVQIERVTTVIETEQVKFINGKAYPMNEIEQCNACYKWYPIKDMHRYRHDQDSDVEWLCEGHYEEACDKSDNDLREVKE